MPWPDSQDFNEAIQGPQLAFQDADLKCGRPVVDHLGMPLVRSGSFADVYKIFDTGSSKNWAVKCFTRKVLNQQDRYQKISDHLRRTNIPYMVGFNYLAEGVRVGGQRYPIVKMEWFEGIPLNEFVKRSLDQPATLEALFDRWVLLATQLRLAGLAHGDLQHGNVLLMDHGQGEIDLKLVDYDGMFVPALRGTVSGEAGHAAYQHPRRLADGVYSIDVDRFPHLVIGCALRALRIGGEKLWSRYDDGDNLLFKQHDFDSPQESALLRELWQSPDPMTKHLAGHIIRATASRIGDEPHLPDLVGAGVLPVVSEGEERTVEAILTRPPMKPATKSTHAPVGTKTLNSGKKQKISKGIITSGASVSPAYAQPSVHTGTRQTPVSASTAASPSRLTLPRRSQTNADSTGQWFLSILAVCLIILVVGQRWHSYSSSSSIVEEIRMYDLPTTTIRSIGLELIRIPAGEFRMGTDVHIPQGTVRIGSYDGDNAETPAHLVTIRQEFELGKYAVTQSEWASVMNSKPWQGHQYVREGDRFPATYVSWLGAVKFCNELSRKEGLPEYYSIANEESVTTPDFLGNGYRLPTEAEWEYACRGGTKTLWSFRNDERPGDYAWFGELTPEGIASVSSFSGANRHQNATLRNQSGSSGEVQLRPGEALFAHEVGRKKPNPFGLYDMHGNVDQWCWDWYGEYSSGAVTDPRGPSQGTSRVQRGGRWDWYSAVTRSGYRSMAPPSSRSPSTGFRVARTFSSSNVLKTPRVAARDQTGKRLTARTTPQLPPVSVEMKLIPAGEFRMGSPMTRAANSPEFGRVIFEDALRSQNEGPQHLVQITSPFCMGVYEVTQEQFFQVVERRPSQYSSHGRAAVRVAGHDTQQFPVESVSWYDAIDFCNKLSERNGHDASYQMEHVERTEGSIVSATVTLVGGPGFRLPTEAEWEYACRANTTTPYSCGSTLDFDMANFEGNSAYGTYSYHKSDKGKYLGRPAVVGSYPPNKFGLHEMHGNVYEWCWDWANDSYDSTVESSVTVDPIGPQSGSVRIARGGGFDSSAQATRSAYRGDAAPSHRGGTVGFRVARTP